MERDRHNSEAEDTLREMPAYQDMVDIQAVGTHPSRVQAEEDRIAEVGDSDMEERRVGWESRNYLDSVRYWVDQQLAGLS
jgi:hypothetical protein